MGNSLMRAAGSCPCIGTKSRCLWPETSTSFDSWINCRLSCGRGCEGRRQWLFMPEGIARVVAVSTRIFDFVPASGYFKSKAHLLSDRQDDVRSKHHDAFKSDLPFGRGSGLPVMNDAVALANDR